MSLSKQIEAAREAVKQANSICLTSMPPKYVRDIRVTEEEYKTILEALTPTKCGSVGKEACMAYDQIAEDCKACNEAAQRQPRKACTTDALMEIISAGYDRSANDSNFEVSMAIYNALIEAGVVEVE